MKFGLLLVIITTGVSVFGQHLCSRSKTDIKCEPYSKDKEPCYRCPDTCSGSSCEELCDDFCHDQTCAYVTGSLQCSLGCLAGLTGKVCQETCDNCIRCHQFTSECCPEGFGGPYCQTSMTTRSIPTTYSSSSATSSSGSPPTTTTIDVRTDASSNVSQITTTDLGPTITEEITVKTKEESSEAGVSIGLIIMIAGVVGLVVVLTLLGCKVASHYRQVKRAEAEKATYHKYDSIGNQLDKTASLA